MKVTLFSSMAIMAVLFASEGQALKIHQIEDTIPSDFSQTETEVEAESRGQSRS